MAAPAALSLHELFLEVLQQPKDHSWGFKHGSELTQGAILEAVADRLRLQRSSAGHRGLLSREEEEAILTHWQDLFRTGLMAWGINLSNPDHPFCHLTDRGNAAVAKASRHPANRAGYLRHLDSLGELDPIARSYVEEALDCYALGLNKAGAVMTGCASEHLALQLSRKLQARFSEMSSRSRKNLNAIQAGSLMRELHRCLDERLPKGKLRELFEPWWRMLTHQIRCARNEAGHPNTLDPITPELLESLLLQLPALVKVVFEISEWVDCREATEESY